MPENTYKYSAEVDQVNGTFEASFPDLPNIGKVYSDNLDDLLAKAKEMLTDAVEEMLDAGQELPKPMAGTAYQVTVEI